MGCQAQVSQHLGGFPRPAHAAPGVEPGRLVNCSSSGSTMRREYLSPGAIPRIADLLRTAVILLDPIASKVIRERHKFVRVACMTFLRGMKGKGSMRQLYRVLLWVGLFLALLTPTFAMADEYHSWCTPSAIGKSRTGSTNGVVNQIVSGVCDLPGFSNCCDQNNGRWTLACVQAGAEYAKTTLNQGDICGRYAWALGPMVNGPLQNRTQLYPRDFNLFTLSGNATGFTDVQGPVAAAGNVSASYFGLNNGSSDPYGLVAAGNVSLNSGTIHGNIICDQKHVPLVSVLAGRKSLPSFTSQFLGKRWVACQVEPDLLYERALGQSGLRRIRTCVAVCDGPRLGRQIHQNCRLSTCGRSIVGWFRSWVVDSRMEPHTTSQDA
jgi:hypothetical protein